MPCVPSCNKELLKESPPLGGLPDTMISSSSQLPRLCLLGWRPDRIIFPLPPKGGVEWTNDRSKTQKWRTVKMSWFSQKQWLGIARNASCFVMSVPCKWLVMFTPKRRVNWAPCLYNAVSLICASKYPTLHTDVCETINSMAIQNWFPSGVKYDLSGQSLHLFHVPIFISSFVGSTQESLYSYSSALVVVIYRFPFYLKRVLNGHNLQVAHFC